MAFRVGQKVVCVDASGWPNNWLWNYPVKNEVYTVRELDQWSDGRPAIRLEEVRNRVGYSACGTMNCEPMFVSSRFRPVMDRKTDIGFAHEILRKVTRKSPALAQGEG